MVRQVYFQTIPKVGAAGAMSGINAGTQVRVGYTTDQHETGGGTLLKAPNVEITVPDNWGGNTLVSKDVMDSDNHANGITYVEPMADSFSLNIIMKANGNINTYYKLRDQFLRLWGMGEFTVIIKTSDDQGGKQCVNGYISNFVFDEFRSGNDVSGSATFTPTTPWYFEFAGPDDKQFNRKFSDCPVYGGAPKTNPEGYTMVQARFVEAYHIHNVGSMGFKFNSISLGDPLWTRSTYILPDDFVETPSSYLIMAGYVYAKDTSGNVIGRIALPQGITAFGMDGNAIVDDLHYAETYDALSVLNIG